MAGRAAVRHLPEGKAGKLLKYGGDPSNLTPAQARRVRKAERRERG